MKATKIRSASSRSPLPSRRGSTPGRLFLCALFAGAGLGLAVAAPARAQSTPLSEGRSSGLVEPTSLEEKPKPDLAALFPAQCPLQEFVAGVQDGFSSSNGVEAAVPSVALQAAVGGPFADFDGTAPDVHFAHTFRLPPCKCIVGAKLEISAKALGSCGQSSSGNDAITLGFSTLAGFPRWGAFLGSGNTSTSPALSTPCWGSAPLQRLLTLDLAALPVVPPGTISLLSAMQTNRYLDVYVQDDTAIDYLKLKVTMCDCCQQNGKAEICVAKFNDKNRNGVRDSSETGLQGWTFQAKDQAGGNAFTSPPTDATGKICFGVLAPATYNVSEVPQSGWSQTTPVSPANPAVTVTPGGAPINLTFGNWRKVTPDDTGANPKDPH